MLLVRRSQNYITLDDRIFPYTDRRQIAAEYCEAERVRHMWIAPMRHTSEFLLPQTAWAKTEVERGQRATFVGRGQRRNYLLQTE